MAQSPSTSRLSRPFVLTVLSLLALLSAYTAFYVNHVNGLGDAMERYILPPSLSNPESTDAAPGYPGSPQPLTTQFTGNVVLDTIVAYLTGFFSALLDSKKWDDISLANRLFTVWGLVQFEGCGALVMLEGLRRGNKGVWGGWTTFAVSAMQVMSFMLVTNLWAMIHILTSPLSRPSRSSQSIRHGHARARTAKAGVAPTEAAPAPAPASSEVLVSNLWDLAVFPMTVTLSCLVPTVFIFLPSPSILSAAKHYGWIAAWQAYPIYHFVLQNILSRLGRAVFVDPEPRDHATGKQLSRDEASLRYLRRAYGFITLMCGVVHLPVIATTLLGPLLELNYVGLHVLPAGLRRYAQLLKGVSLRSVFFPYMPWSYPHIPDSRIDSLESGEVAPLAVHFLQYDIYVGISGLFIWAIWQYQCSLGGGGSEGENDREKSLSSTSGFPRTSRSRELVKRAALWFCVAGPVGAIAEILWRRDEEVMETQRLREMKKDD